MSSSWERPSSRGKTPSFSSSLLESIYHSTDESHGQERRNNSAETGGEITSLRRAIMVEKWMEKCKTKNATPRRHFNSDSNSSTDSAASIFSSSETESSVFAKTTRKSNILRFYGELKKTKQPISPGRKIRNFLNSIFTSKNKQQQNHRDEDDNTEEEWRSVRKSRSMKATTTTSTSCLSKTASSKSKRSVRFCPVNVILNDDKSSFRDLEVKVVRGIYNEDDNDDDDGRSCASSDLFELENIGSGAAHHRVDASRDELPVYGTTSLKINQAIASGGLFM